jgi:dinuclear metal center YbgI/SA1388 family protein
MTTVASVLSELNARAPGDKAAGWDIHGLQVGDAAAEIRRLAVCHEVTDKVASIAIEGEVDLLVAYHPLLFKPITRLVAGPGPAGRAYRLARAGVGVGIVHTAWDAARGGTADALAAALGLESVEPFGPIDPAPVTKLVTFVPSVAVEGVARALIEVGAGRIGNYSGCSFRSEGIGTFIPGPGSMPVIGRIGGVSAEPEVRLEILVSKPLEAAAIAALLAAHPYDEPAFDLQEVRANLGMIGRVGSSDPPQSLGEFSERVIEVLDAPVRCSGDRNRTVTRVALLPGSGGSFIAGAAGTSADVYITGDLSHHDTRAALDLGLSTIDPGHAATERPGVIELMSFARTILPDVIDLTDDATPWKEN